MGEWRPEHPQRGTGSVKSPPEIFSFVNFSLLTIYFCLLIFNVMDEKRREYMRKYMERKRASVNIDVNKLGVNSEDVNIPWDKEKYPEKAAWEIAVIRAARAKKYAEMFPDKVRPIEARFQTIDWQYENEGLAAIRRPDPIILE